MATLTIRDLPDTLKAQLRVRAAQNNRSMEEEARQILRSALETDVSPRGNLGLRIHQRFQALGGVDLVIPERGAMRDVVPTLHEPDVAYHTQSNDPPARESVIKDASYKSKT